MMDDTEIWEQDGLKYFGATEMEVDGIAGTSDGVYAARQMFEILRDSIGDMYVCPPHIAPNKYVFDNYKFHFPDLEWEPDILL